MHELAIARSIAAIVSRHAAGRPVAVVRVRVGYMRQVVPEALRSAFGLAVEGTDLAGAGLEIEPVAARGDCERCGATTSWEAFPLTCAACGSSEVALSAGEELEVTEFELAEAPAEAADWDA